MEASITVLGLGIAPAYLAWALFASSWLNRRSGQAARFASLQAWVSLGLGGAAILIWLLNGAQSLTVGLGAKQWLGLRLDALSVPLVALVLFLAAIILRFSRNYLSGDARQGHFTKWMSLTLGSVICLVTAPGLFQLLLAWVATSLSLHRLLVYFPERHGTLYAARKKFLLSRCGDLCLALALAALYQRAGAQDFESLLPQLAAIGQQAPWIAWAIALCALLKSAQFPIHTWLPETMGTPTPVSALMHAGIVNAGGALLIRFAPLFDLASGPLYLVATIGALTAIYGAFVMLTQTSVKRALAYSTIAQMGFMMLQCGLGAFEIALVHILAHSLYKAHSFLASGDTVRKITSMSTRQEMADRSLLTFSLAIAFAIALTFALAAAFGLTPANKPGLLSLGVALAIAAAQPIWRQLRKRASLLPAARTLLAVTLFISIYFALSKGAHHWMAELDTSGPALAHIFEYTLAFALLAALATALQFQSGAPGWLSPHKRDALYVHALNGFYLNAIADRALKYIRLHPDQKRS